MSDNMSSAIIGALVGALLAGLLSWFTTYYQLGRQRREEHRKAVAAYVDVLAVAIGGMITEFEHGGVPHEAGHELCALAPEYENLLRSFLPPQATKNLHDLETLCKEAEGIDWILKVGDGVPPAVMEEWVTHLKRVKGDLRALATQLRTPTSG